MKINVIFALFVVAVFAIGCIDDVVPAFNNSDETKTNVELDAEFDDYLIKYKQRRLFGDNISYVNRSVYGLSLRIFEELPIMPADFLRKTYLIKVGRSFDIEGLGPEYWKQPEFDPEFSRSGLKYWQDWSRSGFVKNHWTTMGIRSYPYSQYVETVPGNSFNVTLFISADWSVETYQGLRIRPVWIDSAVSQSGGVLNSTPGAGDYINVNVTPVEFLLGPAFPKFTYDWTKRVVFTGKVDNNTPDGLYILSVDVGPPSKENSDVWFLNNLNLYSEGLQMIKLDKPYLQVFINVNTDGEERA